MRNFLIWGLLRILWISDYLKKNGRKHLEKNLTAERNDWYLLGHFEPCLLETEDGTAVERGRDLEQSIVVVEAAADISYSHPLLNHRHTHVDVVPVQDLCGDPVADLRRTYSYLRVYVSLPVCLFIHTLLKCLVVLIMYGVLSFLPVFIQPWPKNSLQKCIHVDFYSNQHHIQNLCMWICTHILTHMGWPWRPGGPAVWVARLSPGQSGSQTAQSYRPTWPNTQKTNVRDTVKTMKPKLILN